MINNKEDFERLYIVVSEETSEETLNEIKDKLYRLEIEMRSVEWKWRIDFPFIIYTDDNYVTMLHKDCIIKNKKEISVEDFLKEEDHEVDMDKLVINDIVAHGAGIERVHIPFNDFQEPTTLDNGFEALSWLIKNPMKTARVEGSSHAMRFVTYRYNDKKKTMQYYNPFTHHECWVDWEKIHGLNDWTNIKVVPQSEEEVMAMVNNEIELSRKEKEEETEDEEFEIKQDSPFPLTFTVEENGTLSMESKCLDTEDKEEELKEAGGVLYNPKDFEPEYKDGELIRLRCIKMVSGPSVKVTTFSEDNILDAAIKEIQREIDRRDSLNLRRFQPIIVGMKAAIEILEDLNNR